MSSALSRLVEGIRIHKQMPGSRLICSGNSMSRRTTQAEMLANAAIGLGVSPNDTIQSRFPKNTLEEIHAYNMRFGNKYPAIIVTSSYHMPRVQLICEREGLKLIPAPTDYYLKTNPLKKGRFDFKPSATKIQMLQSALHEYAGMLKLKCFDY
ncbi:MAG: YdcF family protein [Cyclobacteriaceae bacterium]|nr:YdcF family protein [Cyclobacteriaceae bacterium]